MLFPSCQKFFLAHWLGFLSDYMKVDEVQPDHEDDVEGHADVEYDIEKLAVSEFIIHFIIHKTYLIYHQS